MHCSEAAGVNSQSSRDTRDYPRLLADGVSSMLAYWDRDLRCRFANLAYKTWFGVEPDELIGKTIQELLGPALYALNEPYILAALGGQEQTFERLVPGPGGTRRHSLAHYIPDIVDGEVLGFLVEVTEVTRLKQVESALREEMIERQRAYELLSKSEVALKEAQRLGQIGSWEWEPASDTVWWSDELYRIFGRTPGQVPPGYAEHATRYTPASSSDLRKAVAQAFDSGQPFTLELEYVRPDGSTGWIESHGEAVRDASGRIVKLRGTALDVTVRRQAEEARLQRDLAQAASRNKTLFLSRVSHEFRTPLNAVLGFAQLIQADPSAQPMHRQWAELIRQSGAQMLSLVNDVLDLSGADSGHITVKNTILDVGELVRERLSLRSVQAQEAKVKLLAALPEAPPLRASADPARLRQVVDSLVSNAILYNKPGGQVAVGAALVGEFVEISIQDTGIGMTPAQLSRLYMPFDRLGAERTRVEGAGVALVLTKRLLELMGGNLRVESQEGVGSRFTATLRAVI